MGIEQKPADMLEAPGVVAEERITILLAEDNADDVLLMKTGFKKVAKDCTVLTVPDGEQAIEYLQGAGRYSDRTEFPFPALVLLDLSMPGMSGFEVLQWVRSQFNFRTLPVIVFSGSISPADVAKAYDLGANSFLVKPFALKQLYATLKGLTGFWLESCRLPSLPGAPATKPG